jgi:CO/xanthine dehydrogenase FAD-binding subunit
MLPRPSLPSFDYVRTETYDQAVQLLLDHGEEARLMMGGTDLFVQMRRRAIRPRLVLDVKHLPGMRDIVHNGAIGLSIGAAVTMNQLASDPYVRTYYPLLAEAAASVATYQVRNRATIGGNLCNASPCADTTPAILVLGGHIVLRGSSGEREVPAERFVIGPGKTALQPGELLTQIRFPLPPPGSEGKYLKLGRSRVGDLALVGVAVFAFVDEEVASGWRFRIALGSVGPVAMRVHEAEALLASNAPGDESFDLAASIAKEVATPIDDVRATAMYQKAMVYALTRRALQQVWEQLARSRA